MLQLLAETDIVKVEYDADIYLFKHTWNDQTRTMTNEEYKKLVLFVSSWLQKVEARLHLIDTSKFNFTINPYIQEWVAEQVFPVVAAQGGKKMAFLISEDLFAQISIEQFVEENRVAVVQVMYFETETAALKWLLA